MSFLIDDVARTLASSSRREAFRSIGRLLAGASLGTFVVRHASAATEPCGSTPNQTASVTTGKCPGSGVPDGAAIGAWSGNFTCPSTCSTKTSSGVTCTGGGSGNSCTTAAPCTLTGTIKCACGVSTCGAGMCCCSNGTCASSAQTGNCNPNYC
jgi:hypothetical protein